MTPAASALGHALYRLGVEQWIELDELQRNELRRLVCETVDEYKSNARSPEHTVIGLRQIARDAGYRPELMPGTIFAREHLLTEIVGWSMDHYFSSTER